MAELSQLTARIARRRGAVRVLGLRAGAQALVAARIIEAHPHTPALVVCESAKPCDRALADLRALLGEPAADADSRVRMFPHPDTLPYDRFSPQPFIVAQRMDVLHRLCAWHDGDGDDDATRTRATRDGDGGGGGDDDATRTHATRDGDGDATRASATRDGGDDDATRTPPVIVAPWRALLLRVPSRAAVRGASLRLARGEHHEREALLEALVRAGYTRQPAVEECGEFAVRGGLLDLFPPGRARPVRVEFHGDEIESLREFDPASQRSQREIENLRAPPAREVLGERALFLERAAALRALARKLKVPQAQQDALSSALLRGQLLPGVEALAPLLQPAIESVLDFFPARAPLLLLEPADGRARMRHFEQETAERYSALAHAQERVACAPDALFETMRALDAALHTRRAVSLERLAIYDAAADVSTYEVASEDHEALQRALQKNASTQTRTHPSTHAPSADGDLPTRALMQTATPPSPPRADLESPLDALFDAVARFRARGLRVVVTARALSTAERLRALFAARKIKTRIAHAPAPEKTWSTDGTVEVRLANFSAGFVLPSAKLAVLCDAEIFGARGNRFTGPPTTARRRGAAPDARAAFQNGEALAGLAPGDFLVHAEHGIGVYRGLVLLELGHFRDEFLRIEYAGRDRLFVPVHRLNLVQRYIGGDTAPRIDKLGGATWARTRAGVKRRVRVMARELLEVHAARKTARGFAFAPRDPGLMEFEARFPHPETPDQQAAIDDVLADLAKPQPMDRLVCGDVGYGKTEVAARAAHQVLMAGKQVAVLAPTTVLCQQHVETFAARFAETPVRCKALSRFCTPRETRALLLELEKGELDLVVGTHRLLQKNVRFRDLGLLVVDEEHRFGVAHKERIKQLKQSVDVLTLSATPIPRTLEMAFTGLRDLSVMETPPEGRLAIRTRVCRFDEALIREAILREVRRGGQVFFVHNRVRSIASFADWLAKLVPSVTLQVAHGQLPERELETRMLAFMRGKFDVLLCTTLIESGLDVPRAGTILIDRADTLGLAQLYQLRGRVGRSTRRAYAYLMVHAPQTRGPATDGDGDAAPRKKQKRDAQRRLEAIQELAELGSGFRLASLDLEIRGAGNLLGDDQSGHLTAVGYDAYLELLDECIEELRGQTRTRAPDPEIRLPLPARLPESFVPDVSQRLVLYKRLASAASENEAAGLRDELLDRFGALPRETENLLGVIRLKIAARELGVSKLELAGEELQLTAAAESRVDPLRLLALLENARHEIRVTPDQRIRARVTTADTRNPDALLARAQAVLTQLAQAV